MVKQEVVIVGGHRKLSKKRVDAIQAHLADLAKKTPPNSRAWINKPPNVKTQDSRIKLSDEDIVDIQAAVKKGWTIAELVLWFEKRGRTVGYNLVQRAAKGKLAPRPEK